MITRFVRTITRASEQQGSRDTRYSYFLDHDSSFHDYYINVRARKADKSCLKAKDKLNLRI
jgi:hypothetical protein